MTTKHMTLTEAAEYVRVAPYTLREAARLGHVRASKPFGRWLFLRVDLDAAFNANANRRAKRGA